MKTTPFKKAIILLAAALVWGGGHCDAHASSVEKAKNIVLFIGDGMGAEHRKAARWSLVGNSGKLEMDDMAFDGSIRTRSADNPVTDSAAGATAMSTGVKTKNGVIGLDMNLKSVTTILENAKVQGKRVGLVTTTQLTHATPAAFAAHAKNRNLTGQIAVQILSADVDVLLGGGEDEFLPTAENGCYPEAGKRRDGRNLINAAVASGYLYVCEPGAFNAVEPLPTTRLIGIFADEGMTRPFSPSLADMTQKAIGILSQGPNGFFLMVEGGQIDWASHDNNAANAISDVKGLDEAVSVAKNFALKNPDTLIIVTADHETGGMAVSSSSSGLPGEDGPFYMPDGDRFYVNWSTTAHTSADVPVTSQGPLSNILTGMHDNTFIHDVMLDAIDKE